MRGDSNEVVVQGELLGFGKKAGQQQQQQRLDQSGREGLDEGLIKVDENHHHHQLQDPVKKSREGGQKLSEGGLVDMQILENGGGDLPSFSIKRLRMLPLRGGTGNNNQHQQSVATAESNFKPEPNGNNGARSNENGYVGSDNEKENEKKERVAVEGKGVEWPAPAAANESAERKDDKPCEDASEGAPPIGDDGEVGISREEDVVQSLDSASNNKQQQIEDDGCSALDDTSPGVNNEEEVVNRQSVGVIPNGVTGSDISSGVPGLDRQPLHELRREGQTGEDLGKEFSVQQLLVSYQTFSEFMSCEKVPAGGGGMQVKDKDHRQEEKENVDASSDDTTPKAVDDSSSIMKTDSEPEQKKPEETIGSSPTSTEGELPDSQQPDAALTSEEHEKLVGVPTPGIVQILPAVLGNKFGSAEETTDEDDSPRSSLGFANPDGDPNFLPLPYSGQIMYPGHYSNSQSPAGPSLLQYSGSMSLRSDSSTTSNRSFAFPILAPPEWNSSPVRMAKADPRYLRRRRRWDGCCFFRLGRSRYKY